MQFPQHIFKAYDIRGLADGELSSDLAYSLGRAFVHFLRETDPAAAARKLVVGRDMRETSGDFQEALMRGVNDEGMTVIDIGLASTPLFNFACAHYPEHGGGIMVTASHNPAEYNGFKMTLGDGLPVGKNNGMGRIYELVCSLSDTASVSVRGRQEQKTVLDDYLTQILALVPPTSIGPLRLVVDGGNGMGNVTIPHLLKKLPVTVDYLYMEPDGRFPNHEANPLKVETLRDLQAKIRSASSKGGPAAGWDFGFALDGDADRIGVVDETGAVVGASFAAALIGLEVLRGHPGGHMLYDLRSSAIIHEVWQAAGATTEMSTVGHALIKKMMKDTGAIFASELSLHLYYHDMYDVESSDLSLLYLLQLLSLEHKPLSTLVAPLKKYVHSGEINFTVADKAGTLKRIEEIYAPQAQKVSHLDGLWLQFPWGWFSVREANTEPFLRLNLETSTPEMTEEKVAEVRWVIERK